MSHPNCVERHVCQQHSGHTCIETGCDEAAGTLWGPYWCPEHDQERLDRCSASLEAILGALTPPPQPTPSGRR